MEAFISNEFSIIETQEGFSYQIIVISLPFLTFILPGLVTLESVIVGYCVISQKCLKLLMTSVTHDSVIS